MSNWCNVQLYKLSDPQISVFKMVNVCSLVKTFFGSLGPFGQELIYFIYIEILSHSNMSNWWNVQWYKFSNTQISFLKLVNVCSLVKTYFGSLGPFGQNLLYFIHTIIFSHFYVYTLENIPWNELCNTLGYVFKVDSLLSLVKTLFCLPGTC